MHFELVNCITVNLSPTSDLQLILNMLSGHSTLTIVLRLSLNSHRHRPCLRELIHVRSGSTSVDTALVCEPPCESCDLCTIELPF